MNTTATKLVELIGALRERRYPTILVAVGESPAMTSGDLRDVAAKCSLGYVNFREEMLAAPGCDIVLGAYLRGHFLEWLRATARSRGGLLVEKADEVISSWPEPDRRAFLMELLRTECNDPSDPTRRTPIVLVSRFVSKYALPKRDSGQGLVFNPEDQKGGQGHA